MTPRRSGSILSIALAAALLLTLACAAKRPVLYPNGKLQSTGKQASQAAIDDCFAEAEAFGAGGNAAGRVAGGAAAGGAAGAATGGVYGAIRGNPGPRAAAGAAVGATAGAIRGVFRMRDPDPIQMRFVNTCLVNQGYQIIGWR